MTAQKIARIGDSVQITCSAHGPTTGTISTGSSKIFSGGVGVARVGDTGTLACGHPFRIITGSSVTDIDGVKVARLTDQVQITSGATGTGTITTASAGGDTV